MQWIDPEFRKQKGQYVIQCALATVTVLFILVLLGRLHQGAIIASLGATAFIVFALPKSRASGIRCVVGGYLVGAGIGWAFRWITGLGLVANPVADNYLVIALGALGVGLAIFVMTVTNTEHPPAAGVTLSLVIDEWTGKTVLVVLGAVVLLCAMRRLLGRRLKDLA